MKAEKRKRIIDKHRDALLRFGHTPNAVYWSNHSNQELRFEVLLETGLPTGCSLLDVGCGFGDLYAWLKRHGVSVNYTGIDLSPELIEKAQALHPDGHFYCGDLFDFDPAEQAFDYVWLSGALNEELDDEGAYARKLITRMYQTSRNGSAFNLLNANDEWVVSRFDLQSFKPDEMLAFCQQMCANSQLRDDYRENDFTISMKKS